MGKKKSKKEILRKNIEMLGSTLWRMRLDAEAEKACGISANEVHALAYGLGIGLGIGFFAASEEVHWGLANHKFTLDEAMDLAKLDLVQAIGDYKKSRDASRHDDPPVVGCCSQCRTGA